MKYDFSHWGDNLPKVSCQCITYGRTNLLDEAVKCFLEQDYPGEKELIILNDYQKLKIHCDIENVLVVNLPRRMRTIGEKRNACVALCSGQIIFPWDDDDISLPHRISYSLTKMTNLHYYKGDRAWLWKNKIIDPKPSKHIMHAMGAWSTALFDEVGGYPHIESGQDQAIETLFRKADGNRRVVEKLEPENIYYIYRFPGTGSYHLSTSGYGKGMENVRKYVEKKIKVAFHEIIPHSAQNYTDLIKNTFLIKNTLGVAHGTTTI